jgi:hypothetical protein
VDYEELLKVASGYPREKGWTAASLVDAIVKISGSEDLTRIVKALLVMDEGEVKKLADRLGKRPRK